jgi:hypothetical protein
MKKGFRRFRIDWTFHDWRSRLTCNIIYMWCIMLGFYWVLFKCVLEIGICITTWISTGMRFDVSQDGFTTVKQWQNVGWFEGSLFQKCFKIHPILIHFDSFCFLRWSADVAEAAEVSECCCKIYRTPAHIQIRSSFALFYPLYPWLILIISYPFISFYHKAYPLAI